MKSLIKELVAKYKKEVEFEYSPTHQLSISNKGFDDQLLVLFLTYNLVGSTKKSLSYIADGITYPRTNDNAVHFFNLNADGDLVLLNATQSKKSEDPTEQVKKQISSILRNLFQLERGNKTFADKSFIDHFNSIIDDQEEDFTELSKIIYILTDAELNEKELKILDNYANVSAGDYENVSIFVIDKSRFSKETTRDTVIPNRTAIINLFNKEDVLKFKNDSEEACVVNLSAKALKKTYQDFGIDLFDYNLRYFVTTKAQDSEVVKTIKNNPGDFWLFNNGLVITCDKFSIKDGKIEINKITIVNGGQTTSIIGSTEFDKDFPVLAKVISIGNSKSEKMERMTEIAVYANSQKPIKARDLKANTKEQRDLQKLMFEKGVFLAVKRGEKATLEIEEGWQETTNEEVGQILLATLFQMPGAARSQKASIFKKNYNMLFKRTQPYHPDYLIDLLKLRTYVMDIDYKERGYFGLKAGIFANSKLFILAALSYLLTENNNEKLDFELYRKNLDENPSKKIRIKDLVNVDKLNQLTDAIVDIVQEGYYSMKKEQFANETYPISNFTKLDGNYETYVLSKISKIKQDN